METLGAREVGGCVTQDSDNLIANAKYDSGELAGYRLLVQRGRIWLVDGCL